MEKVSDTITRENIKGSPQSCITDEHIIMEIRNIAINGYTSTEIEENSVPYLKVILNHLAHSHSKDVGKPFTQPNHALNETGYEQIQEILFDVAEITNAGNIDVNLFKKGVEKLSISRDEVLKSNKNIAYVRGKIFQSKPFLKCIENQCWDSKIMNVNPEKRLPLVYDVLLAIFYFSGTKTRQYHFHDLLDYYYNTLEEILRDTELDLFSIMTSEEFDVQIKKFLPFVKLETAFRLCQELVQKVKTADEADLKTNLKQFLDKNNDYKNSISTSMTELHECILNPNLSREDCYKIVRNNIGLGGYEFLNWKLTPVDIRSGYLGDYFKLKINIKHENECKTLHLFAKYLPTTNEVVLEIATEAFDKEEFFYATYIPELKSLGMDDIADFLPECYFSRSNDVLVFEDVSLLNYSSLKASEALPYETVKVVIKQIAKLHACSLLCEEITTEKTGKLARIDDKYEKYTREVAFRLDAVSNNGNIVTCGMKAVLDYMLDEFPDVPKAFTMEEFKVKVKKAFDLVYEKVKKSNRYRNVFCHGDFWMNNILFKMNNHKPSTCYIIDYQLTRYCPPSHDLLFFIYINTDRETRSKYMGQLLEEYYIELSNILKTYNSDLNKIYTYEEFLDSCRYMKSACVCIASLYLQMTCYPTEKIQKLMVDETKATYVFTQDRKELFEEMKCNKLYRQRIRDIVEDLYEVCENDII